MRYEAGTSSPAVSPTYHVRSGTIAAHRGQLPEAVFAQNPSRLAERMGFEPTKGLPPYALSRGGIRFRNYNENRAIALDLAGIPHLSPVSGYSQVPA